MPRTLIESPSYGKMAAALGDARRLDEVLRGVTWSLSENAEAWPIVRGFRTIRLAKTDGYGDTPRLRIWFRILNDNEVELLGIEPDPAVENGDDAED